MKILIAGASGMLGHKLALILSRDFEMTGTVRPGSSYITENAAFKDVSFFEITGGNDILQYKKIIQNVKPDVVINCIGTIKHVADEKTTGDFVWANSWLPHALAEIAAEHNIRLVTFGTDCVFSGDKGQPYLPADTPDPADIYGMSKYLGELNAPPCLTLRTSIIGPELRGKKSLLEWVIAQEGKTIRGYTNALYSGFPTYEVASILKQIFEEHPDLTGLWQAASPGISKFDLLHLINDAMNLGIKIEAYDAFKCDRRLDGADFSAKTGIVSPVWPVLVERMVEDYVRHRDLYNRS